LAKRVAEVAALPVQDQNRRLWQELNGLRPVRPLVMISEVPWHEMNVNQELTTTTSDPFCLTWETSLRRTLYAWRHFPVDDVVEAVVYVPKTIRMTGFGLEVEERTISVDRENEIVSHGYRDQLARTADVDKIRTPELTLDLEATARDEARAHEIFDGILQVHMQGSLPDFWLWDEIVRLRGA